MARKELQEINAGSMADIAFLLLIFFLVTTTMDTDSGLTRRLPQMPDEEKPKPDDENLIKERNIFLVLVNRNNQLMVENQLMDITQLRAAAKEFIENPNDDPNLPAKSEIDVPYFGKIMTTKNHVISLQTDNGTSYGTYITVQNELVAAYNELRNAKAMQKFGIKYTDMKEGDDRMDAIEDIYPLAISEAEPKNIGGK
ncbi:MAG: biopolymer transporter ExbD [Bacteroidales bacterium]|nr:biopolymer transporter ExbD [Bacteroidales bacterium]